ncbi:MAG: hypothetical protein KF780_00035 [Sphingomonas sp.]|nr:hypothetical protein [Sphingomonas sp.]
MFVMSSTAAMAIAMVLVSAPSESGIAETTTSAAADTSEQTIGTGAWRGSFLQRYWTFEFSHQNGRWSGRYMRSDGRDWHALTELMVSGRAVSFSFVSSPRIIFALELNADGRSLSGTATVDGVGVVPFSAARAP